MLATQPQGQWYLLNRVDGEVPPEARDPKIDGLSIRVSWSSLEPNDDDFRWQYLDSMFEWAKRYDKLLMLRVMTGPLSPTHGFTDSVEGIPAPWDQRLTREYAKLISALGKRYAGENTLRVVHVSGFWRSAEFHVPRGVAGDQRMVGAFKRRILATAAAFPNQLIALNHSPEPFSEAVVNWTLDKLGSRACIQMNALKASTNTRWIGYSRIRELGQSGCACVGWQFVGPSSNSARFGGSFDEAVNLGRAGNPTYWEVYRKDVRQIAPPP